MVDDPNRKTPRQFQCRDYLWDSFEQLSGELECSIDYLINEAMRHYLRAQGRTGPSRNSQVEVPSRPSLPSPQPMGSPQGRPGAPAVPARQPALPPMPAAGRVTAIPSLQSQQQPGRPSMPGGMQGGMPAGMQGGMQGGMPGGMQGGMPGPMPGGMQGGMQQGGPMTPGARAPAAMPNLPQRGAPPGAMPKLNAQPPMVQQPPPMQQQQQPMQQQRPAPAAQRTLFAVYGDQEVPVNKEEFFIGRGQKMCDLVIRDTNISRQHARVVLHNGAYWMIDNQSTNGVEFRGAKIQQKKVDDGDVFTICGHDVHFFYR